MAEQKRWHVGAQNDILYVIDKPPRPSNDDINPNADVEVIAKVYQAKEGHAVEAARANLLAAAPEMFAALTAYRKAQRSLLERWADGDHTIKRELWGNLHACEEAATSAIAKAEGRS